MLTTAFDANDGPDRGAPVCGTQVLTSDCEGYSPMILRWTGEWPEPTPAPEHGGAWAVSGRQGALYSISDLGYSIGNYASSILFEEPDVSRFERFEDAKQYLAEMLQQAIEGLTEALEGVEETEAFDPHGEWVPYFMTLKRPEDDLG